MITYSLACDRGHGFDSWFKSSSAFDEQRESGLLSCPHCGSGKVEKAVMAPRLARKDKGGEAKPVEGRQEGPKPEGKTMSEKLPL